MRPMSFKRDQQTGVQPRSGDQEKGLGPTDASVVAIIVNYRTPHLTKRCLAALSEERRLLPSLKAVVIDGGSGDGSADQIEKYLADPSYAGWVYFMPLSLNGGFGWANNQAILWLSRANKALQYIYLLNPDAQVRPRAISALLQEMQEFPRCGAAGSRLLDSDGRPTASAFVFPSAKREFASAAESEKLAKLLGIPPFVISSELSVEADWVTGASVMFRSEALRDVGLFDDGFFLYFEEVELMHRLKRKGWQVRHVPSSEVVHLEGASTGVGARSRSSSLPPYWYQSRSRYFFLTGGRSALVTANLAASVGAVLGARLRLVNKGQARPIVKHMFRGASRTKASVPRWGDAPGRPPAWMAKRG